MQGWGAGKAGRTGLKSQCSLSPPSHLDEFWTTIRAPRFPVDFKGRNVDQAQLELQLRVWKDLAISKQVLMRVATDALKLSPETTQDELKKALEAVIVKIGKADADVASAQEQARQAVSAMEKKVLASDRARTEAQALAQELQAKQENGARELVTERAAVAKELQRLKDAVAEKDKALKAINTALADTPENVLKKMNAFKKQKQEEADARRLIETSLNTLRAEKRKLDEKVAEAQKNTAKLITQHRELHALTLKLHEQLKSLEAKDVSAVPDLDDTLLEAIESPDAEGKKTNGKSNGKDKDKDKAKHKGKK